MVMLNHILHVCVLLYRQALTSLSADHSKEKNLMLRLVQTNSTLTDDHLSTLLVWFSKFSDMMCNHVSAVKTTIDTDLENRKLAVTGIIDGAKLLSIPDGRFLDVMPRTKADGLKATIQQL